MSLTSEMADSGEKPDANKQSTPSVPRSKDGDATEVESLHPLKDPTTGALELMAGLELTSTVMGKSSTPAGTPAQDSGAVSTVEPMETEVDLQSALLSLLPPQLLRRARKLQTYSLISIQRSLQRLNWSRMRE